jgi:hypothetical protein
MRSVFLSHCFDDRRAPLLDATRNIIEAIVGRPPVEGKIINGSAILPAVKDKVAECDAVVCLLTQAAQRTGWVYAEYFVSIGLDKSVVLVLEMPLTGAANALRDVIQIRYENDPLPAIGELAAHLGLLKQAAGREVKAMLLPEDLRERAALPGAVCEYTSHSPIYKNEPTWARAHLVSGYPRGVYAILPSVREGHVVRVRITANNSIYSSPFPVEQNLVLNLS